MTKLMKRISIIIILFLTCIAPKCMAIPGSVVVKATSAAVDSVCAGINSTLLELQGEVGTIVRWEYSFSGNNPWTSIAHTTDQYTITNLSTSMYIRAVVLDGTESASTAVYLRADQPTNAGTLAGNTTVCSGSNSGTNRLSGYIGRINSWIYSNDLGSSWTSNASQTLDSLSYSNLTTTTWYRVQVKSGACALDTSGIVKVIVKDQTVAGSVLIGGSGSKHVCRGINTGTMTLTGHTGEILAWEKAANLSGPWTQLFNNTTTQTFTNLTSTSYYRAIVSSTPCDTLYSSAMGIIVDLTSNSGTLTGDLVNCVGSNTGTLTTNGYTGAPTNWLSSTDSLSWSLVANASASYTYNSLTDSTWFKAIVTNGSCSPDTSDAIKVNINPTTVGGSVNSKSECYQNNSGALALSGHTGEILRWENASNSGGPWSTISNTTSFLNYQNLLNTTHFRAVLKNQGCLEQNSAFGTVTIEPTSDAGNIVGNSSVCSNSNAFTLKTSSAVGTTVTWLSSIDSGSNWTNEAVTNDSISKINLASETWFKYVVKSGTCENDTTTSFKVKVDATPVGGSLTGATAVCSGSNSGTISLSGQTGNVIRWETAVNATGPWSAVNHSATSLSFVNLTNSVYYRAILGSSSCPEATSDSAYVKVEPKLIGGKVSGSTTGCEGQNSGLIVLNGYGGSITKWEYSENGGVTWNDSLTSLASFSYSNLSKTTWFRAQVQAGVCGSTYSDTAIITIFSEPVVNFTTPRTCQDKVVGFQNLTIKGNNNQYTWAFGNGNSSNLQNPQYAYSSADTFSVTLTALTTDNCSASLTQSIIIDSIPMVAFTKMDICQGDTVDFRNISTPVGGTSSWSFGDGGSSTLYSPKYKYGSEGNYLVGLTFKSPNGCEVLKSQNIHVHAQPVTAFSHPRISEKKAYQYTNSSAISTGTLGYQWNFGNGSSSIVQNPSHMYNDTGRYSVSLVSFTQYCRDTLVKVVVANPLPKADFNASNLCQNDSTLFTNTSTISKGSISFRWDFDDGTFSTVTNPKHRYATAGNYRVELLVTSDSGFASTIIKNVTVNPKPSVNFSTVSGCEKDTTRFKNLSTINGGTLSYIWDFGSSAAGSATTDAQFAYRNGGKYGVKLTAVSNSGCIDSLVDSIDVHFLPTVKWSADTVCKGTSTVFSDSTIVSGGRAGSFNWEFGNGTGTNIRNPLYAYTNHGTFIAKLKVTSNFGCTDSLIKNVIVHALPVANYSVSNACERDSINYTNTSFHPSSSAISYRWDFGSSGANSSNASPKFAYARSGTFTAKLVVNTTSTSCADSISKLITIHPRAIPSFSVSGVCNGSSSRFVNTSNISNGSLSHFWQFGDSRSSTVPNPSHLYSNSGPYVVKLTVTTGQGCIDTILQRVHIWPQPLAKFVTQNVCSGDSLVLTNQSTYLNGSTIPDSTIHFSWDFGDGDTIHSKNTKHLYNSSGNFRIELFATTDSGCVSSAQKTIEVYKLPLANFEFTNACENDSSSFSNKSTSIYGNVSSTWYFGDNGNSILESPSHMYASWGTYKVKLEVTNKYSCLDSIVKSVKVFAKPRASFQVNSVCDGETSQFSDSSTIPNGIIESWQWSFGDGTDGNLPNSSHLYLNDGVYNAKLKVNSEFKCWDDTTVQVTIHPLPLADFILSKECLNNPISLKNKASIKSGFVTYQWNFGDGSTYKSDEPNHMTSKPGELSVQQILVSDHNCMDSLSRITEVWKLPNIKTLKDTIVSYGIPFGLEVEGGLSYQWTPNDGLNQSNLSKPTFNALATTEFVVFGTDEKGCINSDTVKVEVEEDYQVFPSEIITPDGNGYNDTWVVKNSENYPNCNVQIMDRWGNVVYKENEYRSTWEGVNTNNDALPDGTYYYIISFEGAERTFKGALTIIRNN